MTGHTIPRRIRCEDYHDRILIDPEIRFGKPTVRGTRITVGDVLSCLASGMSENEILRDFPSLAREGGLQSTLWAGPESFSRSVLRGEHPVQGVTRKHPVSLRLGFAGNEFSFAIDLGLPPPGNEAFAHDPQIKRECIWAGTTLRPSATLVDRQLPHLAEAVGTAMVAAGITLGVRHAPPPGG